MNNPDNIPTRAAYLFIGMTILIAVLLLLQGCARPRVRLNGGSAIGPKDIGTPATVETGGTVTTLPVPAGSTVETRPAQPATPTTAGVPASVRVILAGPSEMRSESHAERASSGTVDSTVAVKRIEVESAAAARKPLLWVAIGCGVLGVMARVLVKEWPAVGNALLGAAALAGLAWKVSEVPWWAFAGLLVVVGGIIAGYKRAEWDANKDGIPDVLQK